MAKQYSNKDKKDDPYLEREQSLYTHPVPSREFIIQYLEEIDRPVSFQHLQKLFNLKTVEEKEGLRRRLIAMTRDGQLMVNRRGSYALVKEMALVRGRVQGHRDGFGFLIPDSGPPDIFLPAKEMRAVFSDDVVLVRVINPQEKRLEGVVVDILERHTQQVVGRYCEESGAGFVDPDNKLISQEIVIPADQTLGAKPGQFVMTEITAQPTKRRQPVGKIIEILGDHLTPGMEVELAIRSHELPYRWSGEVLSQSKEFPIDVLEADKRGREDLRQLPFVTIDGEDAKDFDDAVYCQSEGETATLYVAIADVSHYVKRHTPLDKEAKLRGNSVYFPTKVLPMLPEILSNNLCSLRPNQDRLVVVCEMKINAAGSVDQYRFYDAVIHSQVRLTYTEVAAMLSLKSSARPALLVHLKELEKVYKKLLKQRVYRGAIEFSTTETRIEFDNLGKIKRIVPLVRNDAHRIIEECMLAANESASRFLHAAKIATLYRVHEGPDPQKLKDLRDFLKVFGLRLGGGDKPRPADYGKLLERIEKRPDAALLQTVMLRSLRQAIYTPHNVGHFGLSYEGYCHFTSPIRRYPDLIIHRSIKHLFRERADSFYYSEKEMVSLGEHCSMTERRADLATREAMDWLKCEYMLSKVGQTFPGHIVDVTGFGLFVALDAIYVTGLLHVTSLQNDYYFHDPLQRLLRGKRSGKIYRLGDPVQVLVAKVNRDERQIDFALAEE